MLNYCKHCGNWFNSPTKSDMCYSCSFLVDEVSRTDSEAIDQEEKHTTQDSSIGKKSLFTVKKVLKAFALICMIVVFCPAFLVSCSGQKMKVSALTAVGGVSMYGEKVVEPHPIMLICFVLPIAIFVLLMLKSYADKKSATFVAACAVIDLIIWIIFRSTVKSIAESNYCSFKTTGWFVINICSISLIILLSILVVVKKLQMSSDLLEIIMGGGTQDALGKMSTTMSHISSAVTQLAGNVAANEGIKRGKNDNTIGFCAKCGSQIEYGSQFCSSCGIPVPQSMIEEAEAAK